MAVEHGFRRAAEGWTVRVVELHTSLRSEPLDEGRPQSRLYGSPSTSLVPIIAATGAEQLLRVTRPTAQAAYRRPRRTVSWLGLVTGRERKRSHEASRIFMPRTAVSGYGTNTQLDPRLQ